MATDAVMKLIDRAQTPISQCLSPSLTGVDDTQVFVDYTNVPRDKLDKAVEPLLEELLPESSTKPLKDCSYDALNKLYTLSTSKENRVPLVCSTKHDIISPLIRILLFEEMSDDDNSVEVRQDEGGRKPGVNPPERRKLACLILNNLSIPFENKAIMALGPLANDLFHALAAVMRRNLAESYLCCICLMNITFLDDAVKPALQYTPSVTSSPKEKEFDGSFELTTNKNKNSVRALQNSHSMLRCLESILNDCPVKPTEVCIRGETVRWACGLLRNVTNDEVNAKLIGQTDIPSVLAGYIKAAPLDLVEWTENSLEENALVAIFNLARFEFSKQALIKCGAADAVSPLMGLGGIHDFRATMIWSTLEDKPAPSKNVQRQSETSYVSV